MMRTAPASLIVFLAPRVAAAEDELDRTLKAGYPAALEITVTFMSVQGPCRPGGALPPARETPSLMLDRATFDGDPEIMLELLARSNSADHALAQKLHDLVGAQRFQRLLDTDARTAPWQRVVCKLPQPQREEWDARWGAREQPTLRCTSP